MYKGADTSSLSLSESIMRAFFAFTVAPSSLSPPLPLLRGALSDSEPLDAVALRFFFCWAPKSLPDSDPLPDFSDLRDAGVPDREREPECARDPERDLVPLLDRDPEREDPPDLEWGVADRERRLWLREREREFARSSICKLGD